jgi:hypothetical protein
MSDARVWQITIPLGNGDGDIGPLLSTTARESFVLHSLSFESGVPLHALHLHNKLHVSKQTTSYRNKRGETQWKWNP